MWDFWPETPVGPRTTGRAQVALAAAQVALSAARSDLLAAAEVGWVSAAADRYRGLLAEAIGDASRLGVALGEAHGSVLRHTRASDEARAIDEAERAAWWVLPDRATDPHPEPTTTPGGTR